MNDHPLLYSIPVRSVFFYLTGKCNLRCGYCYFRHKDKQRDLDETFLGISLSALKSHPDSRKIRFVLSGGEPLLKWPLLERSVRLIRANFASNPIKVQTNAVLLDPEKLAFLRQTGVGLEVGIDGDFFSTARYRVGITEPVFNHVVDHISCARKLGIPVSATMTVHPNQTDLLLRNFLYLYSVGLRNIDITPAAFLPWGSPLISRFKAAYSELTGHIDKKEQIHIAIAEDVQQRNLMWDLSFEDCGIVMPGDVFLCLSPSVKRRLSLMRYKDGRLEEDLKNFAFFKGCFDRRSAETGVTFFSARDYVIFSFEVLKDIVPVSKRRGCADMASLLSFLRRAHQKYTLR